MVKRLFSLLMLVALSEPAFSGILYVNDDAGGSGTGEDWTNAYTTLQTALENAVSGDDIWVASGTYLPSVQVPSAAGLRYRTFQLINGVSLYGGFAGTESTLEERDVEANETILSGDLGIQDDNSDNAYHVIYHPPGTDLDNSAVLDGFTVTGGNADGPDYSSTGGGIYNYGSSPTITNCTFMNNSASYKGAAMHNRECAAVISDCIFTQNTGGAISIQRASPIVTGCTFTNNSSSAMSGGGALNLVYTSNAVFTDCIFEDNSGSIGGAVNMTADSEPAEEMAPTFINSLFINNMATNSSAFGGGAFFCGEANPVLINCVLHGNSAYKGGALYSNSYDAELTIRNTIIWGNSATLSGDQIYTFGTIYIGNSCYSVGGNDIIDFTDMVETSCINSDPIFSGLAEHPYDLQGVSPCIEAGDNDFIPDSVTTDLMGNNRIINSNIDIGAYEYTGPEILVLIESDTIPSGTGYNFGTVNTGSSNSIDVTIINKGGSDLILNGSPKIEISGTNNDEFTLDFAATADFISPEGSTTFSIAFVPTTDGAKTALISFDNNDLDEDPFIIELAGVGYNEYPLVQSSEIEFPFVQTTNVQVNWTNGDGSKRVAFMKAGNSGTALPVDNVTYTADGEFGSGSQIGTTGWYCIHNGSGNSAEVSGLTASQDYIVQVFEYKGGAGSERYLTVTATNNPNTVTTRTSQIYFVRQDGNDANDGLSWSNAFASLQTAINSAEFGDQICVGAGTYKPDSYPNGGTTPVEMHFSMIDGIEIYGGFPAEGGLWSERKWQENQTILSGDLNGDDGENFANRTDNVYHLFYHPDGLGLTSLTVLDGFIISGGNAAYFNGPHNSGAGIYNFNNDLTIINCRFEDNKADAYGGASYNAQNTVTFTGCIFNGNTADNAGAVINSTGDAAYTNCLFTNNEAPGGNGGALYSQNTTLIVTNSTIADNSAYYEAVGLGGYGGGLYVMDGSMAINNSIVWGNLAYPESNRGDQIYVWGAIISQANNSCYATGSNDINGGITATSCINTDPQFLMAGDYPYLPVGYSPVIDAGNNTLIAESYDIRGEGFDRKLDKTTGAAGTADMGAYEYRFGNDPVITLPEISVQPTNSTVCEETAAEFVIQATGEGTITYRWQVSTDDGNSFADIEALDPYADPTNDTLEITSPPSAFNNYMYRCNVSNEGGTLTSGHALLTVNRTTSISKDPWPVDVCPGVPIILSAEASGSGVLGFQWFKNDAAVTDSTNADYRIAGLTPSDTGYYYVEVTGICGTVASDLAHVGIYDATEIISQPRSQGVCMGDDVTVSIEAKGTNTITYRWFKNEEEIIDFNSPELNISSFSQEDSGSYYCIVSALCNDITSLEALITRNTIPPEVVCADSQERSLTEGETHYIVNGTEFDPVSITSDCMPVSVLNDFNSSNSLDTAELPLGDNTVVWTATDHNGNVQTCNLTITVNSFVNINEQNTEGWEIYPNPTTGTLWIIPKIPLAPLQIEIFDPSGSLIESDYLPVTDQEIKYDVSHINKGMYIIRIIQDDRISTVKFIKK